MTPPRTGKAALIAALLCSLSAFAADQETRMSVTTTPNPVPEHESLQLIISVDSPLSTPVVQPTFDAPDFTVMGAPGLNFMPQNGEDGPNTRKKLTFTFVLMPKKAGDFFVRNIRSRAGNVPISSPDTQIRVTGDPTGSRPQPPPSGSRIDDESTNPASPSYPGSSVTGTPSTPARPSMSVPERFNSDFTVWANVTKTKAYINEPIVVEYYLYDFGGLRHSEILQWPTFTGFWKEDLELTTHVEFEDVMVKQQEMRRAFISRYAIYGIKPGIYSIDKLGIRGKYVSPDMMHPGVLFGFDTRTGQHYSQEVTVQILPLPEQGRPAKFGGAVGKFRLQLEADKATVPQNSPITFTFTLTGTGNFQAIDSIGLPLPPDFELYESQASGRSLAPIGVRQELESKKTFKVVAIPRKEGKFEIPAVEWSFFNTEKEIYETISTSPLTVEVTHGEANASGSNTYLGPRDSKGVPIPVADEFRPLKPLEAFEKRSPLGPISVSLWVLFALNVALAFRFLRAKTKGLYKLVKGIDKFSEARILLLQAKGIKDSEWQAGLEEVVLMTMQILLDTNPRGLTKSDLEDQWKSKGLPAPLFLRASALLDEIDRHRFSSQKLSGSGTTEVRSRLTKETESLLSEAALVKRK